MMFSSSLSRKRGFYTLSENGVTVAISTVLTPELIEEGFVREIISKIQTMRKDSGFEVMDHITVSVSGSEKVMAVVDKNREAISHDVLADDIVLGENVGNEKDWDINGEKSFYRREEELILRHKKKSRQDSFRAVLLFFVLGYKPCTAPLHKTQKMAR